MLARREFGGHRRKRDANVLVRTRARHYVEPHRDAIPGSHDLARLHGPSVSRSERALRLGYGMLFIAKH